MPTMEAQNISSSRKFVPQKPSGKIYCFEVVTGKGVSSSTEFILRIFHILYSFLSSYFFCYRAESKFMCVFRARLKDVMKRVNNSITAWKERKKNFCSLTSSEAFYAIAAAVWYMYVDTSFFFWCTRKTSVRWWLQSFWSLQQLFFYLNFAIPQKSDFNIFLCCAWSVAICSLRLI